MRKIILAALVVGTLISAGSAEARDGCGPGGHRNRWGYCRPNGPYYRPGVVVAPGLSLVIGQFYAGRGYWDGHRYWQHWDGHRGWQDGDRRWDHHDRDDWHRR